jgi:hypothetical protein
MKRVVLQSIKNPPSHKGVFFRSLHFVEGEVFSYRGLPLMAVFVAREGVRFYNLAQSKDMDLGWVKLFAARLPEDWEGSYYEYVRMNDLPGFKDLALDGKAVILTTERTHKYFLVVSEDAWENNWEEVKQYLLQQGYASVEKSQLGKVSITLGGAPEFEVVVDGETYKADDFLVFHKGDPNSPFGVNWESPQDSTLAIHPTPTSSPKAYVKRFMTIAEKLGRAGFTLSVAGDTYPLGANIRIGSPDKNIVQVLQDEVESFVEVLEDFIGRVLLPTSGKARGSNFVAYELIRGGWEYRTPPSSFYADPEMVRIVYKLTKGLVETLLKKGEISYETLRNGKVKKEEYYRFLTAWEAEYFLSFPQKWIRGKIVPFVPVGNAPRVLFRFRFLWGLGAVLKRELKDLPVKRPIRLVFYKLGEHMGDYFAIPTAPEEWRLKEKFPHPTYVDGIIPEVWIGIPYRFAEREKMPEGLLKEFISWVREYLAHWIY